MLCVARRIRWRHAKTGAQGAGAAPSSRRLLVAASCCWPRSPALRWVRRSAGGDWQGWPLLLCSAQPRCSATHRPGLGRRRSLSRSTRSRSVLTTRLAMRRSSFASHGWARTRTRPSRSPSCAKARLAARARQHTSCPRTAPHACGPTRHSLWRCPAPPSTSCASAPPLSEHATESSGLGARMDRHRSVRTHSNRHLQPRTLISTPCPASNSLYTAHRHRRRHTPRLRRLQSHHRLGRPCHRACRRQRPRRGRRRRQF